MTPPSKKTILLLGANGRTGREVLHRALDEGHTVTAVVRSPDRLEVRHERLQIQVGSACDSAFLEEIMPGHDAVISTLGPRFPSRASSAVYPESGAAIVSAMWGASVDRLLVTSSALLFPEEDWMSRALRWLVPPIVDGARKMEAHIRGSNVDWTLVRTSFLTNGSSMTHRVGVESLPQRPGSVSRAAVAAFLLQETSEPRHRRQVVGLCG